MMVEDKSVICLPDLTKSTSDSTGPSYISLAMTDKGIDMMVGVIQKHLVAIKEKSERCPFEALALLQHLSEKWTNLLRLRKMRGVACQMLAVANHFQRTTAIQRIPLSEIFVSEVSAIVIGEMVGGVPEEQCSIKEEERVMLWTMCLGSFKEMLTASLKASVISGDLICRLVTETEVFVKNELLSSYAIDYYRCVGLMSPDNETVNTLSNKILNMMLNYKLT